MNMNVEHIVTLAPNALYIKSGKQHFLRSYETLVGFVDEEGKPHRWWPGSSKTTSRHWKKFLAHCGVPFVKFDSLEVEVR